MSPKPSTLASTTVDSLCRHISPKGNRCHMLIDRSQRPANGAKRPTLCAYHAGRLHSDVPSVDPDLLAADLLGDIDDFSTAGSVNLFLGNLVRQLARKRIARRDAIALAYISQLLLNSLPPLERQLAAEKESEYEKFVNRVLAKSSELAALRAQPAASAPPPQVANDARPASQNNDAPSVTRNNEEQRVSLNTSRTTPIDPFGEAG